MANTSILTAFERMWQHITAKLGDKASKTEAQNYALDAANTVKNDLLNGAGGAYDTLKELGDLIDDNVDAIDALEVVAAGKANATHSHTVTDITDLTATATELNCLNGVNSNVQDQLASKVSKYGSTMTGNLEIQNNREQSPVLTISGTANESGRRASTYIVKAANSTSNGGTEITDKAFDSSTTSLVINKSSGAISHRLTLRDMDSNYQITNYLIYGEHNKPSPEDIGAVSKADQRWNLIYDSGEISAIANSISNIDVSGYTNIQVLVRIYNDGDSINSRAGSAIFTCENGKTYQFPVWSNMFSKSINTVYTMATFNLVDGWLVCPYASRLIGDASTFDSEGGTAGNLTPTGSGVLKCTSPLSTLTVSSLDQNSNYYFGMGSRVMVWGWNA